MSAPQWTADIHIDAALAADLIGAQFAHLRALRVEAFGAGWDNAAFLVDGRIVFRFPRRRIAARSIEREIAFLPDVARSVSLPISAPARAGASSERFPWAFAGYDQLPGSTACSRALSHVQRYALAAPLGRFLRDLHALDPAPLAARGLPPDELGRLAHTKRYAATLARLPAIEASGSGAYADAARSAAWLGAHPPRAISASAHRFVHGDLYARHLLIDRDARLCGIIDWGDLHLGDPAIDLSIAHLMLPEPAHAAFRAAYGSIDERTWSVARYRAIYHAILELEYGIREDDAAMRRSGAGALALMREAVR